MKKYQLDACHPTLSRVIKFSNSQKEIKEIKEKLLILSSDWDIEICNQLTKKLLKK